MTTYYAIALMIGAVLGTTLWVQRTIKQLIKEIKHMSTVIAALQQVDSDLATQVQQNTADTAALIVDVQTLTKELADATTGQIDPVAVQTIVSDLQAKVAVLKTSHDAAVAILNPPAPVATDPAPVSTDPVDPNAPGSSTAV